MNDFLDPPPRTAANRVEPGKRPQSSMCPAIILDQQAQVLMVVGGSGSALITSATAYVRHKAIVLNFLDFTPLQSAIVLLLIMPLITISQLHDY